jgi:phosphoglycerate dehydrogenase-like enzyme
VIGVDIRTHQDEAYERIYPLEKLTHILSEADVVVLTLPLTEETHHLIDRSALSGMKSGAIVVNIARGAIVDTEALVDALGSHLGGAVLDVFEKEPLSESSPLRTMKNVYLLPHKAGPTLDRRKYIGRAIAEEILRFYNNEPLVLSIHKDQAARMTRHKK